MQTTTLIISLVAVAVALLLVYLIIRAAGGKDGVALNLGDNKFQAGIATERAEAIRADGPLLFSDVAGGGQRRPIFLNHTGDDATTGWSVFDAHPPGTAEDCFLRWSATREVFTTTCNSTTFPADGGDLPNYRWEVTTDGALVIDVRNLRSATRTSTQR